MNSKIIYNSYFLIDKKSRKQHPAHLEQKPLLTIVIVSNNISDNIIA